MPGRQGPRAQQHRQRLEVAAGAGGERPRVVHRQLDGARRRRPGGLEVGLVGGGDRLAEAGLAAELEGRHDAGEVLGVRLEDPRAEQPRRRCAPGWRPAAALYGDAAPRDVTWPCAHAQLSARSGSSAAASAGRPIRSTGSGPRRGGSRRTPSWRRTTTRHSQGRSRACALGAGGGEQPRQARLVELDEREVVRLEGA